MEWLAMCLLLLSGVTQNNDEMLSASPIHYSSISEHYASSLVEDYNDILRESYGENIPAMKAGVSAVGMVIIREESSEELSTLSIKARIEKEDASPPEYITFTIQADNDKKLPATIESARIVYIGNQLIVDDIKSDLAVNFLIESENGMNKTPFISTVNAEKITVKRGNFVEINI